MLTYKINLFDSAISIGTGIIEPLLSELKITDKIVITNSNVGSIFQHIIEKLYVDSLSKSSNVIQLSDGEKYKNSESLNIIYAHLLSQHCDRQTILIALGGGVIGDLVGFAAATYMRGIRFIQVPTTLLAMVDSSVGGKTGINHPLGKNMIGAFHQPIAVIADVSVLDTLPDRELRCGVAEIIKHACIADEEYFVWLENNVKKLLARDSEALIHAIKRSVEIKAKVVGEDEKEQGIRAILNFGHTFAHAIEAGLGFGVWLHGEAVGAGLVAAATLSLRLGHIDKVTLSRIHSLVELAGLPTKLPKLPLSAAQQTQAQRYLELMRLDKKSAAGQIRYIVLDKLGAASVMPVDDQLIAQVINECLG